MLFDFLVPIPDGKIKRKKSGNSIYIYYLVDSLYNHKKHYSEPEWKCIGKVCSDDSSKMYPNDAYLLIFSDVDVPEEKLSACRSRAINIGNYIVIKKMMEDVNLDTILHGVLKNRTGLFLDLAAYSIVTENNVAQYYPDYAYNHPLFTDNMRIYSDSKISDFFDEITEDDKWNFFDVWNANKCKDKEIYISYDSTNKVSEAGDIDMVEVGHSKTGKELPIINYSIAYDCNNSQPLLYEDYPGSIVDVSELKMMVNKIKSFGYKQVCFTLDRGYFAQDDLQYIDNNEFNFLIMVKGKKNLVRNLVEEIMDTFEDNMNFYIKKYGVYGKTIKHELFPSNDKERYFHIFYNAQKAAQEKSKIEEDIGRMEDTLKKMEHSDGYVIPKTYETYFDPMYVVETRKEKDENGAEIEKKVQVFVLATKKIDVIRRELKLCGYFALVTSKEMSAKEALTNYKGRDSSEKLFREDKSFLGNHCERVYTEQRLQAKIFVEFVALIIRNEIFKHLSNEMGNTGKRSYMTVPAAIRELEKITLIKQANGKYILDHAVTKKGKEILGAFGISGSYINKEIEKVAKELEAL